MAIYKVQGPDNFIYKFEGPEDATQDEQISYAMQMYDKRQADLAKPVTKTEALKGGAKRMLSSLETGVSGLFGAEEAAKAGQARQEAITERSGTDLEKVKQAYQDKGILSAGREVARQVPYAIAEQLPNLATTVAGARAGATLGGMFGGIPGALIGGVGGAFAPSLLQQAGSNLERQAQEGKPVSGTAAYGAAVPQAALDVFTDKLLFSRLMGLPVRQLGRGEADAVVAKSIKRTLAEGTAVGVVAEVPTEVAQQMLERYQAGLSLTDDDARKEYASTAYQTALLGPLGAVGKFQERGAARDVIAQDEAEKARQAEIAAAQAREAAAQAERQATGVMEQQPMYTPEEAPVPPEPVGPPTAIPEPTTTMPTEFGFNAKGEYVETPIPEQDITYRTRGKNADYSMYGRPVYPEVAPEAVPEGQGDLFTSKGKPTPEALASVETARLQGLPAQIAELNKTPEGRKELASNMKMYFPELEGDARNKLRRQIQSGKYGQVPAPVEAAPVPVEAPEGTLTPAILKSFGLSATKKSDKGIYDTLVNSDVASPMTQQLLTTLASSGANRGPSANQAVIANRILDKYKPIAEATNEQPEEIVTEGPPLPRVQKNRVRTPAKQPRTEQGVGMPVQAAETPVEEAPAVVGAGLEPISEPVSGRDAGAAISAEPQPSALTPKEIRAQAKAAEAAAKAKAKEQAAAAAALKKLPLAKLWEDFETGVAFGKLSKVGKDRVRDAVAGNFLTQDLADEITRIEAGNVRATAAGRAIKPETLLDESPAQAPAAKPEVTTTAQPSTKKEPVKYAQPKKNMTPQEENMYVETYVDGKSIHEVAEFIAQTAPNKSFRVIAKSVGNMLTRLEAAGINFGFEVVHDPLGISGTSRGARGETHGRYRLDDNFVRVRVNGANVYQKEYVGTNYITILHELIHASTMSAIRLGNKGLAANTKLGQDVTALYDTYNHIIKHFNKRVADSKAGKVELTEFEQDWLNRRNNSMLDPDEIIAWGLTDKRMQAYLESIPSTKTETLWSEFVTKVRTLLGIPASDNTAFSDILKHSENILNADVDTMRNVAEGVKQSLTQDEKVSYQIDPQAQAEAQQYINSMSGTLIAIPRTASPSPAQVVKSIGEELMRNPEGAAKMSAGIIDRFRTKVIDKNAAMAVLVQDANDGAAYNVNGQIRADLLASQVANMSNLTDAAMTMGTIDILPNGALQAKEAQYSVDGIYRSAKQLADKIGVEEMRTLVTQSFYHYRAASLLSLPKNMWPDNWLKDPRMVPTQAQIKAGMDAFNRFPELKEMQRQFIGTKNQMVKFLQKAGFLTDEKAKEFLADDSYAPWLRLKEYQETAPNMGNMGRMVNLSQMKALVGGTEEVNDMLENMSKMIAWCVRSGAMNHSANVSLDALSTLNAAKKHGGRPTSGDPSHVVMTYTNGKPTFWTIDNPDHLAAFQTIKGLNSPFMREVARWMGTLRAAIVLFPAFPVRQVVMDSQRAFLQAGVERPWPMMGKIFKSFLTGEAYKGAAQDIMDLKSFGVIGEADFNTHDTTRGRSKEYGLEGDATGIVNKWLDSPAYKALHKLAYSADLSVRLGIYRQTLEETGDKTLAATRAREIINFQKAGTSEMMQTLKQTIPFLGAYLQGMDVNYRSMIGRGNSMKQRRAAAAAYWTNMAIYAGLTMVYTMAMSGDDEYEEQKGIVTDRNFLIPGIGVLPVPPDVGFLGKVIPERITDYILQEGTDNPESAARLGEGITQAAATAFLPPAAVYGVTPYVELKMNRSFFSDMPIVGQHYQGREKAMQYSPSTSEIAKSVGAMTDSSPLQVDYLMRAIGGTSGAALLQLADVVMGTSTIAPEKSPIYGSFQTKAVGGRYMEEYYAVRKLTEEAYITRQAIIAEGDIPKLEEFMARPEVQARLQRRAEIESIHTMLGNVTKAKNAIINNTDPSVTAEDKRQQVNELMMNVENMLKEANIRKTRTELE